MLKEVENVMEGFKEIKKEKWFYPEACVYPILYIDPQIGRNSRE